MKVWIELQNNKEQSYECVERIDDTDRYKIFIYGENGVLAIINKGDLKNLLTSEDEEES